jgi:hypothetical protein
VAGTCSGRGASPSWRDETVLGCRRGCDRRLRARAAPQFGGPGIASSTGPFAKRRRSCCIRVIARLSAWTRSSRPTAARRRAMTPAAIEAPARSASVRSATAPVSRGQSDTGVPSRCIDAEYGRCTRGRDAQTPPFCRAKFPNLLDDHGATRGPSPCHLRGRYTLRHSDTRPVATVSPGTPRVSRVHRALLDTLSAAGHARRSHCRRPLGVCGREGTSRARQTRRVFSRFVRCGYAPGAVRRLPAAVDCVRPALCIEHK